MSGCCKNSSPLMCHGSDVCKLKVKSSVCDMTKTKGCRGVTTENTYKCGSTTMKVKCTLDHNAPFDQGPWTQSKSWSLDCCKNVDNLTMHGSVNQDGKCSGWVDWGAQTDRPYLSFYSTHSSDVGKGVFSFGNGLVVTKPTWGYSAQLSKDHNEVQTFCDNGWWKGVGGNLTLAWKSCVSMKDFTKKGSLGVQYNVTPDVTGWLSFDQKNAVAVSDVPQGDVCASLLWDNADLPWSVGACVGRQVDGKVCASVGVKHKCDDCHTTNVAVDCDLNAKVSWCKKVSDHVSMSGCLAVPAQLWKGQGGNWKTDLMLSSTMKIDNC